MNYTKVKCLSLINDRYIYVDDKEMYIADKILGKNNIRMEIEQEFISENKPFICIQCKVRKSSREDFVRTMKELYNRMTNFNDTEYTEFCKEMLSGVSKVWKLQTLKFIGVTER